MPREFLAFMRGKVKENANYFVANPVVYRFVAKMPDLAPLVDMNMPILATLASSWLAGKRCGV